MSKIYLLLFFFSFFITPKFTISQNSVVGISKKLTSNKREWLWKGTEITLGTKCINGEVLIFRDSTVIQKKCQMGRWTNIKSKWSVFRMDNDFKIKIGDQQYDIILGREDGKDRLVLRTMTPVKNEPTMDKVYLSE